MPLSDLKKGNAPTPATPKPVKAGGGGGGLSGLRDRAGIEQPKGGKGIPGVAGAKKIGGGLLKAVSSLLSIPQQATFRTGSAIGEAIEGRPGAALSELAHIPGEILTAGQMGGDIGFSEAATPVHLRGAIRRGEMEPVVKLPRGLETAANIILDPGNFVLPGGTAAGRRAVATTSMAVEKTLAKEGAELAVRTVQQRTAKDVVSGVEGAVTKALQMENEAQVGAEALARRSAASIQDKLIRGVALSADEQALVTRSLGAEAPELQAKLMDDVTKHAANVRGTVLGVPTYGALRGSATGQKLGSGLEKLRTTVGGSRVRQAFAPGASVEDFVAAGRRGAGIADEAADAAGRAGRVAGRATARHFLDIKGERAGAVEDALSAAGERIGSIFKQHGVKALSATDNQLLEAAFMGDKAAMRALPNMPVAKALYDEALELADEVVSRIDDTALGLEKELANQLRDEIKSEIFSAVGRTKKPGLRAQAGAAPEAMDVGLTRFATNLTRAVNRVENLHFVGRIANEVRDDAGNAIFSLNKRAGWVEVTDPSLRRFVTGETADAEKFAKAIQSIWVPNQGVADEVRDFFARASDTELTGKISEKFRDLEGFWKRQATVSLPGAMAFAMRNNRGNWSLNALQGLVSPKPYITAFSIKRKAEKEISRIIADLQKVGLPVSADDIIKGLSDLPDEESARILLPFLEARKRGILSQGFFDQSFNNKLADALKVQGAAKPGNILTRSIKLTEKPGLWLNKNVEENARLASFIWNYEKTGSWDVAARQTKKFLFDYAELTPTERKFFKHISPFYTFMRKNLGIQAETLVKQPGYLVRKEGVAEAVFGSGGELDKDAPEYAQRGGARRVPTLLQPLVGGAEAFGLRESPLSAATQALEPAAMTAGALANLVPGLKNTQAVKDLKPNQARDLASALVGITGGPVPETFKAAMDVATGKDSFTGRNLTEGEKNLALRTFLKNVPSANRLLRVGGAASPELREKAIAESIKGKSIGALLADLGLGARTTEVK